MECFEVEANVTTTGVDAYELCLSNLEQQFIYFQADPNLNQDC